MSSISPVYAEMLQQLQAKLARALADLDYEEQSKRRSYEDQLYALANDRIKGFTQNTANLIDRGLNRSGIALKAEADLGTAYDQRQAGYGQDLSSSLASLARRRLDAQGDYNMGKASLMRDTANNTPVIPPTPPAPVSSGGGSFSAPAPVSAPRPSYSQPAILTPPAFRANFNNNQYYVAKPRATVGRVVRY